MPDRKDPAQKQESSPEIDAQSIMTALDADGLPHPTLQLADLPDELPLPKLEMGTAKYTVLGELGAGGMGQVYLAYDKDLRRRVALKLVKLSDKIHARRFLEEAQVLSWGGWKVFRRKEKLSYTRICSHPMLLPTT